MVRLYRGTTSKDRQLKTLRSGYVPAYTWFADTEQEARSYAELKQRGGHGDPKLYGGKPVVIETEIPDTHVWQLGSSIDQKARYYKTSRGIHREVREVE